MMDLIEEDNAIHFVSNCDTFRNVAFIMGNLYSKSLIGKLLASKNKFEWISLEMSMILNQMNALQRPDYFANIRSSGKLYKLFKSKGIVSNGDELNKLQQAMILKEKLNRLEQLLNNGCSLNYMFSPSQLYLQNGLKLLAEAKNASYTIDYHALEEYLTTLIIYMNDTFHLLDPDTPVKYLVRKILYSNWTTDHEIVHLAAKTNIFRCMVDCLKPYFKHFNYAHIGRSGLFYSKNNNIITESGLSSAVLKNEEKKQCITAIFM